MRNEDKPVANPLTVLREEFDDWAVLFDPDSGNAFGLNPVGVFIWKRLDGRHTVPELVTELRENCNNVPAEAERHVETFVQDLVEQGLAGYELKR
ncbi:MAG: SynChlorMet cassette protein ScmD [Proteobacteria bacterium]|nr:SynChlorMet cassette protein ScmD [Pseudomonadota bacterium]